MPSLTVVPRQSSVALTGCLSLYRVFQFCGCVFNFSIAILASPCFHCKHTAAVDVFEIAVGKFVSALYVRRESIVDSEMPFGIFGKPVYADKLSLFVWRRPMSTPRTLAVHDNMAFFNELLCEREGVLI